MINRVGYSNFWSNNYLNMSKSALGLMNLNLISQIVKNFLVFSHMQTGSYFSNFLFDDYDTKITNSFKYYRKTEAHHRHTRHKEAFFVRSNLSGYLGSSVKVYRLDNWLLVNWVVFRSFFKTSYKTNNLFSKKLTLKFKYSLNKFKKFEKVLYFKKTYTSKLNIISTCKHKRLFF